MTTAEPLTLPPRLRISTAYRLVSQLYKDRVAERSQVPLINHINEGAIILERIHASPHAVEAFCLHPLIQSDEDLGKRFEGIATYTEISSKTLALAMEYRNIANAFLSDKVRTVEYTRGIFEIEATSQIKLSPLRDVNDMLIADKVQNRKDFILYHRGTHARTKELDHYFDLWLAALGITELRYQELITGL